MSTAGGPPATSVFPMIVSRTSVSQKIVSQKIME